jgi:Glyoxalase-like domain
MPHLPVPTLDHVVVNTQDRLDEAAETYRRLGFTLTPRGYHTLGSMNHLAMFGTDYLELIAAQATDTPSIMAGKGRDQSPPPLAGGGPGEGSKPNPVAIKPTSIRTELLHAPIGLNGLVFGTEDSTSAHQALEAAGVPVDPPRQFSRPVELPGGPRDAVFRTVNLRPGVVPAGRLYFCHHLTPDLVWRDEWRRHPNGVTGVERIVVVADRPAELTAMLSRMFGPEAIRGNMLIMGLATLSVVTPDEFSAGWGDMAPEPAGRSRYMAALGLRVSSLRRTRNVLAANGIEATSEPSRIRVAAREAFAVALDFRE